MKYQVFVDVPNDDWENIKVLSFEIEAETTEEAEEKAAKETESQGYDDYYVWEVTKNDIID